MLVAKRKGINPFFYLYRAGTGKEAGSYTAARDKLSNGKIIV